MEVYDELLRWAEDRGVELHGVAPRPIPGRGMGMVATKPLEVRLRHRTMNTSDRPIQPTPMVNHYVNRSTNAFSMSQAPPYAASTQSAPGSKRDSPKTPRSTPS
jgi:hypothetical protein